jgi:L-amino acid N-acyltransferase YncA
MDRCRLMVPGDVPAVTRLFNAGVDAADLTVDVAHRTEEQVAAWLLAAPPQFESYVVDADAGAMAWASLTRHHERDAYAPTAELTLYVEPAMRRHGVGFELGSHMIARARARSFHSLVTLLPAGAAHGARTAARLGFVEIGTLRGVYPHAGGWLDLTLRQLPLASGARA